MKDDNDISDVRVFAPEQWGSLDRFQYLHQQTYKWDNETRHALSGVSNHFHRGLAILRVAKGHIGKLEEDRKQLEQFGVSKNVRGEELSAMFETIITSLYSSIDCARKVVTSIYKNERGVKQSTRKFFQAVKDGKVADTIPIMIREAFKDCDWYGEFRSFRDAITHSNVGSCHLNKETGKVFYMHSKLAKNGNAIILDDIFEYVGDLSKKTNMFLGSIFRELNNTLIDEPVWQICGYFSGGKIYSRLVRPRDAIDFQSGVCEAFTWFEKEEHPSCPFASKCDAYHRRTKSNH